MRPLSLALRTAAAALWVLADVGAAGLDRVGDLLPDGSFELGDSAPASWEIFRGAAWTNGPTRHGERYVRARSPSERVVCQSDEAPLLPGTDYRLSGWIRCFSGKAWLGVDLLHQDALTDSRQSAPPVSPAAGWQYVAVEVASWAASSARVWFRVNGQADLDDVRLTPVAAPFLANNGLEADERGRLPFWGEEKEDTLLPGRRAGSFRSEPEVKREGKNSAVVIATGHWFAISSVNYPLAAWTERYELSAWAQSEGTACAQILACWADDFQKVVRVDASKTVTGANWERLTLVLIAPTNAATVRLALVSRAGPARFDDAALRRLASRDPRVRLLVNQVGYEQAGPKSVVVASNFFPRDRATLTFQLRRPAGKVVWRRDIPCSGRVSEGAADDWGWYFWRVDFSAWTRAGQYEAGARVGNTQAAWAPISVGPGLLLRETAQNAVDFFFVQRCGGAVPGWHGPCHLDDAKLPDGRHLDATGGWHSAGDYNKLMYEHGDGGVVFALLKGLTSAPECFAVHDRDHDGWPDALEEALWGAQFVAKMQIPETGGLRHHIQQGPGRQWTKWSAPDVHTDNLAGTEDDPVVIPGEGGSPLVCGGWARLSVELNQRGRTNSYLEAALRLWNHASGGGINLGSAHLLLSALELHEVTRQPAYQDYARRCAESLLAQQSKAGRGRGAFGSYGEVTAATLAAFALAYPSDPLSPQVRQALGDYVAFCTRQADNPFGLSRQPDGDSARFFPPDMGASFQLLGRAWAAALIYRLNQDRRALAFAADQLDWLLGKNPLELCLFEGNGRINPPRYHHRYNMIPGRERGAVPGTVPNGFVREMGLADRPGFDLSRGGNRAPSYRTSEPWLVHNLYYLLAVTEFHRATRAVRPGE